MKYDIHVENTKLTSGIREHLDSKLSKLDKYFYTPGTITAKILLKVIREEQSVEIAITTKNLLLRAREAHSDLYAAIDLVIDKLERQIRKNKDRIKSKFHKEKQKDLNLDFESEPSDEKVVKFKKLETKPMDIEEAILEMNLLGHD